VVIVDTNVLVDVLEDEPDWADWSIGRMRELSKIHELAINPIIYAELSLTFDAVEDLDSVVSDLELRYLELPRPALFLAGKAFIRYRRQGGVKTSVLADFCIGAHAAVTGCPILTRDTRRYLGYFPTVDLIAPARTETR
jgi:predicted nucleic acid-binding protein